MGTNNYIVNNNGGGLSQAEVLALIAANSSNGGIPNLPSDPTDFSDPNTPTVWLNGGVMKYWNGTEIKIMDTDDGDNTSLFGTEVGDF